jgi:hypothetical protein
MTAVSWGGQYGLASVLLDAGADHRVYEAKGLRRLVHFAVREEKKFRGDDPQQKVDYQGLPSRLTDRGESIELARNDLERWGSWSRTTNEYRAKMDVEIAERRAREKAEAEEKPE